MPGTFSAAEMARSGPSPDPFNRANLIGVLVLNPGTAMRRRSRAGGEPAKPQRRKTEARKSRITSKARPRGSSITREETEVARLARERDEAVQRQRATADE